MSNPKKHFNIPRGDQVDDEPSLPTVESRCESIKEVVGRNVISLEKALKAYEVTASEYNAYLNRQQKKKDGPAP